MDKASQGAASIVFATGEQPLFRAGDRVRVRAHMPIGHYRVPLYLRGKIGVVESVITPAGIDNEQEGFGHNAGSRRHYYRIAVPLTEIWSASAASAPANSPVTAVHDRLYIEVFENWLERPA